MDIKLTIRFTTGFLIAIAIFVLQSNVALNSSPGTVEAARTVLYVDPDGRDSNPGTSSNPLRTIRRALEMARPGMKVRIRTGVYREKVESVRAGTADAPIIIEADGDDQPVIDGNAFRIDGPEITHPYITFRRIEVRNTRLGLRVENTHHVVIDDNEIHDIGSECVRLRYYARDNTVVNNRVFNCGRLANGEGIYVGTAPEQRYKNGGDPDTSTRNLIRGNEIYRVTEGIDLKEDSSSTVVLYNHVHDATDPDSAGINVRSDRNTIQGNRSRNNAGSGYRLGGDSAQFFSGGDAYQYGVRNLLASNEATGNRQFGYKVMALPQSIDCENNAAWDNDRGSFSNISDCE